jgi:hypothetical protein
MDDETRAALLHDIAFALRGLQGWPPRKGDKDPAEFARRVVEHLARCGYEIRRKPGRAPPSTGRYMG